MKIVVVLFNHIIFVKSINKRHLIIKYNNEGILNFKQFKEMDQDKLDP